MSYIEGEDTEHGSNMEMKEESFPLQGEDTGSTHVDDQTLQLPKHEQHQSFLNELRNSRSTQFKVILSTSVACAFGVLGWSKGQIGPAFLDILAISNTDLEAGSAFITAYFVGRVVGSLLCGGIYSKVNKYLLIGFAMTGNSAMFVVIPWCSRYELMITAHVLHGLMGGVLAVALISMAVSIWGVSPRGRSYLNIFYAAFAVSGLISPMVTSPFLLTVTSYSHNGSSPDEHSLDSPYPYANWNVSTTIVNISGNVSTLQSSMTDFLSPRSNVYKAYSISAGVAMLASIPFIVFFLKSRTSTAQNTKGAAFHFIGHLPLSIKVLQLINIGIYASFFNAIDFTFSGYLTVFCVQHLEWTKTSGSLLTSVVFCATLTGRILGIFLVHHLNSLTILSLSTLTCSIGFLGLALSALAYKDAGIWVSVCVLGIPLGIGWPSILSWSNEHFVHACGKMTAFFMVTAFIGALLSPMLFGYMMEEYSPIWFCYLNLGKSVINIINVVLMVVYSRFLRSLSETVVANNC